MENKSKKTWKIETEGIYQFGKEERIHAAFELILPREELKIKIGGNQNEKYKNRPLFTSIKRKTSTGENN
jgi:hypothetical protein